MVTGSNVFYFNGLRIGEGFFIQPGTTKKGVPGFPDIKKQFLVLGQEPDLFKGGYDALQSFQGKISGKFCSKY